MPTTIREMPLRVRVEWRLQERNRVLAVELIEKLDEKGAVRGKVVTRGDNWIALRRGEEGQTRPFLLRWIGGAPKDGEHLDEKALKQIRETPVGSTIELTWGAKRRA